MAPTVMPTQADFSWLCNRHALKGLFREELVEEVMDQLDRSLVRAFRHFRSLEPIVLQYMEDEKQSL